MTVAFLKFPFLDAIMPHLGAIVGFILAFVLVSRLMKEKRQPSNTVAWLLVMALIPYLGVPLYLIFGGRKLRKMAAGKSAIPRASIPGGSRLPGDPLPVYAQYGTGPVPPVGGNRTHFLPTGEDAFHTLRHQIETAAHSIDIMTFILGADEVGRAIVASLSRRAREGVQVRLMIDALGCLRTRGHFLDELRNAGGKIERFMPVLPVQSRWSANLRNHRKIAIFDRQRAIVGGHNIASEYMGPNPRPDRWRDFGVLIDGPAAAQLNSIFEADWTFAAGLPADASSAQPEVPAQPQENGRSEILAMATGPDVDGDPLYEAILSIIQEADTRIQIITPYFIPDEVLQRTLMVKARTGRDITLIVPARSNHPITDFARNYYLRELCRAGVKVRLFTGGMVHGKVIMVDGKVAMTGSANLDLRSLFVNYEIGTFFFTENDLNEIQSWISQIHSYSRAYDENGLREPGFFANLTEDVSRLLAPLL